ncbi:hypothetical protein PoB_006792700 [Plakobranchus ocellatus]|uniref:Uncharacterized protein n=1 Tax=Plakobranchus ocellatus TaxID=259542 RepID=A0AAV4DBN0_9GAST|nr:hypothetical protein PoB_006792700 [Plakobranchus ocellatus]
MSSSSEILAQHAAIEIPWLSRIKVHIMQGNATLLTAIEIPWPGQNKGIYARILGQTKLTYFTDDGNHKPQLGQEHRLYMGLCEDGA